MINILTSKLRIFNQLYWPDNIIRNSYRSTDKRYARDNRLMNLESSYWLVCLAPRCRLITSWWCTIFQGFGCSPIKVIRELGSERRETVWSLSTVYLKKFVNFYLSTRGPGRVNLWWLIVVKYSMLRRYVYIFNNWNI